MYSPTDTDDVLGDAAMRAPHLLAATQTEATRLYARACELLNGRTEDHHALWNAARQRTAAARVRPATWRTPQDDLPGSAIQFRVALEARAFYGELATLTATEVSDLIDQRRQMAVAPSGRTIAAKHPALAAWVAARDAAWQAAADATAAQLAAHAAAYLAAQPAAIVAALRERGVVLGVDAKGNLTAPANAGLGADEIEGLKLHRAEVVALVRAELAASLMVPV